MANNGLSTAGSVVSGLSSMASAFPGIGTGISTVGSLIGGILQKQGAEQQAAQAAQARKDALKKKADAMRPEYLQKLQMDKMTALGDAAGIDFAKKQLEAQTANQLRAIRESSPSGSATVNAISAALGQRNADEQKLAAQNMEHKQRALSQVSSDLEMLGNKGMALEERRDQWKREGLQAASALENAATANKMTAANTIINSLTSAANSFGKIGTNAAYMGALNKAYNTNEGDVQLPDGYSLTSDSNKMNAINEIQKGASFVAKAADGSNIYSTDGVNWFDEKGNPIK